MRFLVIATLCILGSAGCGRSYEGPTYLGQSAPGLTPEVFAPGVISRPGLYEYGSVWSANGREFFFGVNVGDRAEIRTVRWTGEAWTNETVVISHERYTFGDPFLSPDEQRLFFISDRPMDALVGPPKDYDIWYVERQQSGWSDPVNVGSPINSAADEYYISFSTKGRLYFASNVNNTDNSGNFDIYHADPHDNGYTALTRLPGRANTGAYEADAFVAPDESYLVFGSTRRSGLGRGDLYISFREGDGTWGAAISLGDEINTSGHELCPFVTADGRFFFYTSSEDIYWVDAAILEQFRP